MIATDCTILPYGISNYRRNESVTVQGPYSQPFIFFVAYEWAKQSGVLHNNQTGKAGQGQTDTVAYWVDSQVTKKVKVCEFVTGTGIHATFFF